MGSPQFRKPEPPNVRGTCVRCGVKPQKSQGGGMYRALCSACCEALYRPARGKRAPKPWVRRNADLIGDACERCGFIPEDLCQLDLDHKDGDRTNASPENLQTLCANCHRLKTKRNGDCKRRYS